MARLPLLGVPSIGLLPAVRWCKPRSGDASCGLGAAAGGGTDVRTAGSGGGACTGGGAGSGGSGGWARGSGGGSPVGRPAAKPGAPPA
jgi:hypothetical protein